MFASKKSCYKCGYQKQATDFVDSKRPQGSDGTAAMEDPETAVLNMKAEDELDVMEEGGEGGEENDEDEDEAEEGGGEELDGERDDTMLAPPGATLQPSKATVSNGKKGTASAGASKRDPTVPESVTQVRARTLGLKHLRLTPLQRLPHHDR